MPPKPLAVPHITFIQQDAPVDEYGRALYAVARSIVRALLDSLTDEDLTDLNCPIDLFSMRQMSKLVRLERDKGMYGDGFEWAVHEAVLGREPMVTELVTAALQKASRFVSGDPPTSLLFGYERARYLGFVDAVIDEAGTDAFLLPEGSGRPYRFGPWVSKAAKGKRAEVELADRIKQVWKTDLFLSCQGDPRYFAATVKSQYKDLEGGRGLRLGIVPESTKLGHAPGISYSHDHELWLVTLPDPNGFTGLYRDAYNAVARAVCTIGKQQKPTYFTKPSAKAQKLQAQLEKYPAARVVDIEHALDEAAQQGLVKSKVQLLSVNAPDWLHMKQLTPRIIAPKPKFEPIE